MKRRQFLATLLAGASLSPMDSWANADLPAYHVRKGDTLSSIARRYGVSVQELKDKNRLKSDLIKVGQALSLPSSPAASREMVKSITSSLQSPIRPWSMIVGHHSGIEQGNAAIYHRAHIRRGMKNGLAYHFVIGNGIDSGDGEIEVGQRWTRQLQGGHVKSRMINATSIGICCVGNFETQRPTARQLDSFLWLCRYLQSVRGERSLALKVHKEIDPQTLCPGRYFPTRSLRGKFANGV